MYSTCVSECFVPLMNVTAETIGQSPCSRTISSAPRPLSTVMTVAPGNAPVIAPSAPSRPFAFVATMTRSVTPSAAASVEARTPA